MTKQEAAQVIDVVNSLSKKTKDAIVRNYQPGWFLLCFLECELIKPEGLTETGLARINELVDNELKDKWI